MFVRGIIDSPPEQSESRRRLAAIERALRDLCGRPRPSWGDASADDDAHGDADYGSGEHQQLAASRWERALAVDLAALVRELEGLLLDVVCTPLDLRLRAAELLHVYYLSRLHEPDEYAHASTDEDHHALDGPMTLRSLVSSTCQALEELDPTDRADAARLVHWLAFFAHVLHHQARTATTTRTKTWAYPPTYVAMLHRLVRVLGRSGTALFAAATVVLAACHRHEQCHYHQDKPTMPSTPTATLLLHAVLGARHDSGPDSDGREHLGSALVHVINARGYPCPAARRVELRDALQLIRDLLEHPDAAAQCLFVNDFKVLVDIVLRECADLPLDEPLRGDYLAVLDAALASPWFVEAQGYRKTELLRMLEGLLDAAGAKIDDDDDDAPMPGTVTDALRRILLERIDRLD